MWKGRGWRIERARLDGPVPWVNDIHLLFTQGQNISRLIADSSGQEARNQEGRSKSPSEWKDYGKMT